MQLKNLNDQPHILCTYNRVINKEEKVLVIPASKFKVSYITLTPDQFNDLKERDEIQELKDFTHKNNKVFIFKP